MNEDVQRVIEGTFVVLIVAWILTRAKDFSDVTQSIAGVYVHGVQALMPPPKG